MKKFRYSEVFVDSNIYTLDRDVNKFIDNLPKTYEYGFVIEVNKITYTPVPYLDKMMVNVEYTLIDIDYL